MAFVKGSATFTNGQQSVTNVTLSSGQLSFFASGTSVAVGFDPNVGIVEAIEATGTDSFNLRETWGGTPGTYEFVAWNTVEGLRDAVQAAKGFQTTLQTALDNLGTAAAADLVTSQEDATVGRVLTVGAFGVGTQNTPVILDADEVVKSGFYSAGSTPAVNFFSNFGPMLASGRASSDTAMQINGSMDFGAAIRFRQNGAWDEWAMLWTDANFKFTKNVSGSSVANTATVSGSNLDPAESGTWKNVSGGSIINNGYGLWQKL